MVATGAQLIERGRQEGLAEGLQKGRQEGRQEGRLEGRQEGVVLGQAQTVLKMLRLRFGALPVDVERRVVNATPAALDRWTERLLTAADLEAVFAE